MVGAGAVTVSNDTGFGAENEGNKDVVDVAPNSEVTDSFFLSLLTMGVPNENVGCSKGFAATLLNTDALGGSFE